MAYYRRIKSQFAKIPKENWEHVYERKAFSITSSLTPVALFAQSSNVPSSPAQYLKEIECDVAVFPHPDTSSPYGNSHLFFAWIGIATSTGVDRNWLASYKHTTKHVWDPKPLALIHTPSPYQAHRRFTFPKKSLASGDKLVLACWAEGIGTGGVYVASANKWMAASE